MGDSADREVLLLRVAAWIRQDPDRQTRSELQALLDNFDIPTLSRLFAGRLTFGTAGLRAELGPGPLRMNRLVVRQSTAGLMRHVKDLLAERGQTHVPRIVVGYDARHQSETFAEDAAAVIAAAGGLPLRFDRALPTPLVAFAVRHCGADAGVMITASHNPPADNGYKVYLGDGAQIIPPHDDRIAAAIERAAGAPIPLIAPPSPTLGADLLDAYVHAILGQCPCPDARQVRVVYTPLCGVGAAVTLRAFTEAGFAAPIVVESQVEPDPDFPGLPFPNPEEPGVLDAAVALATARSADVALANDPDADRLGVAIPEPSGQWRALTGNEIGALLADHLLRHTTGADRLVVSTVVSSRLLERLAERFGVHFAATLTGFKWIVRPSFEHPEWQFLFGYEEALGYAVGPVVADKDGIAAAIVFAELTATLLAEGSSPALRLADLAREYGLHATAHWSLRFEDRSSGAAETQRVMARVRAASATRLLGQPTSVLDLALGGGLPPTEAVVWDTSEGTRVVFRPSGTEPKLKVYAEVVIETGSTPSGYQEARALAEQRLGKLHETLAPLFVD